MFEARFYIEVQTEKKLRPKSFEELGLKQFVVALSIAHRIVEKDDEEAPHSCEITLANFDNRLDGYFKAYDILSIWLGWEDTKLSFMGRYILDRPEYHFLDRDASRVILKGKDFVFNLARRRTAMHIEQTGIAELIERMAKKSGLKAEINLPWLKRKFEFTKDSITSDWEVIKRIAEREGNIPITVKWPVRVKPKEVPVGVLELKEWSTSELRGPDGKPLTFGYKIGPANTAILSAIISYRSQKGESGLSTGKRDKFGDTKSSRQFERLPTYPEKTYVEIRKGDWTGVVNKSTVASEQRKQLENLASSQKILELDGTIRGCPWLFVNTLVNLKGLGQYSGKWYLREVNHRIDASGFRTTFKARRTRPWPEKKIKPKESLWEKLRTYPKGVYLMVKKK